MKKIAILTCAVLLSCVLMLTACGDEPNVETPTTEAHTHTFGEWTTVKEATCTEMGQRERICDCGEKETKTIDKLAHTEEIDAAVAPSCTETGLTEGKHCLVCNEVLVKQEIVEAAHTWSTEYQTDKNDHWTCCEKCGVVGEKVSHVVYRSGKLCEVCNMENPDGVRYEISADRTYMVVFGYSGTATHVRIAEEVRGLPVTRIDIDAFRWQDITEVIIPNSVTSIGDRAFKECANLTSINIPNSITTIGWEAFEACSSLTSVIIPDSVTIIGAEAFDRCSSLTSVTVPDSVTYVGVCAFYNCSKLQYTEYENCKYLGNEKSPYVVLIETVNQDENSYTIHPDAKVIADAAFANCSSLTSMIIPDSVITIGGSAFIRCKNLLSVTIGNSVATIGSSAFSECDNLRSIAFGNSVTSIGMYAFMRCSSLTSMSIPDSITTINYGAFYICENLTDIYFNGTKEQWQTIENHSDWNGLTGKYIIHCTDGDIEK